MQYIIEANNNNNQPQFQGGASEFSNKSTKYLDKFLKSQENLSSTRFIQGTLTKKDINMK